ncbi:hypothetical protein, partial [Acinetobacter sp.]|uniref:hypothetical protein n=1 Tax=Acinetobacter sp. TaxID=472 RepID=UPI0025C69297
MKKIKVKNLKQQLLAVSKIVKRNAVLPIMESVKIGGGLLIGTDNNTHVKMPFECEGPEVMVELVLLREIIRKCK